MCVAVVLIVADRSESIGVHLSPKSSISTLPRKAELLTVRNASPVPCQRLPLASSVQARAIVRKSACHSSLCGSAHAQLEILPCFGDVARDVRSSRTYVCVCAHVRLFATMGSVGATSKQTPGVALGKLLENEGAAVGRRSKAPHSPVN